MAWNIDDVLHVREFRHRRRTLGLIRTMVKGAKRHFCQTPQEEQATKRHDKRRQAGAHHDVTLQPAKKQREAHGDHDRADRRYIVYVEEGIEFDMHAPLERNIGDDDGKSPSQHHGHTGPGKPDHRTDRQVEFTCNDQQTRTKRNNAQLCDDTQVVANTEGVEAFTGKRVERELTGRNGEVTEHSKEQKHHADRADFGPRED